MNHTAHGAHDIDWAAMAETLETEGETYSTYVQQAIEELSLFKPQRILDIGSGPGIAACQFAAAFSEAEVTAVDGAPELLARARDRAQRLGLELHTHVAEFPAGLASLPSADLVWSAQVVHHVGDQLGALRELVALVNPGGVLAIVEGGLPARWLPRDLGFGRPGLQSRLNAAADERFNQMRDELPGAVAVAEDWPGMLRTAGLTDVRSKTFLVDHPAPLSAGPRALVRHTLERQRTMLSDFLDAGDLVTLDRLLDASDPAGVDHRPDLFLLTAKTMYSGKVA